MDDMEDMHSFTMHVISKLTDEQLVQWHERAAIMEYDGNISREEAEYRAACDILTQIVEQRKGRR